MRCSWGSGTMVPWGWGTILWSQRAQVLWAWALICHGTRGQRSCGSGRSCDTGVQVFRCSGVLYQGCQELWLHGGSHAIVLGASGSAVAGGSS